MRQKRVKAEPAKPIEQEARELVSGDRQTAYGTPRRSFDNIARVWTGILGPRVLKRPLSPADVALMMIGLKLCREANRAKRDNRTDIVGYALCLDEHCQPLLDGDPDAL